MSISTAPGIPRTGQSNGEQELYNADQVREQLARILGSSAFRNSKRYAAVLTYIVEQTLAGCTEQLKERTIGVDVFGREPNYDTGSDHVVRSAMAEVRKRLAQYYQGDLQDGKLHLELQPGSYVPQFRAERRAVAIDPFTAELTYNTDRNARPLSRRWIAGSAIGAFIVALAL